MSPRAHKGQPLSTSSEWTFELIRAYDREIARIAGVTSRPMPVAFWYSSSSRLWYLLAPIMAGASLAVNRRERSAYHSFDP